MSLICRLRARLAAESGFTLVEMMTSMVVGAIVLVAAFTLMQRSFEASTEVSDRVDAMQRGRTAMDATIRQLRSQVCVAAKLPLLSADATSATFTTDLTDGSQPLRTERRILTFAAAGKGYALTEQDYAMTSGPPTSATVTWAASPKRTVSLISGIARDGTTPFLRYFGYDNSKTPPQFKELTSPVAAADLSAVTQIRVTFAVTPEHPQSTAARGTTLTDEIVLPQADPNQGDPTKTTVSPTC